ncbi:MAG: nitrilase-related carbon-nitrogen hydrolase [Balneolales bacterium]
MRIRSEQLNPIVGDIEGNAAKIRTSLKKAEKESIDLLILPEMCLCGYPPMDLLERESFLKKTEAELQKIIESTGETGLLFGSPVRNLSKTGRPLFNSAVFAHQGELKAVTHKTLLPTYDVFDESRYFESNT